jgi:hypothetical protein
MCCLWISEPVHGCALLRPHPCHPVARWQRSGYRLHQWKLRRWVRWLTHFVTYIFVCYPIHQCCGSVTFWYNAEWRFSSAESKCGMKFLLWWVRGMTLTLCWANIRNMIPLIMSQCGMKFLLCWVCGMTLKVHKRENFLGFDFEICTFS